MDLEKLEQNGINCTDGLQRFVGRQNLYEKYLIQFLSDSHLSDALTAWQKQDNQELLEQVHALKGLAGTLGLTAVYEESKLIVQMLRDGKVETLDEHMELLKQIAGETKCWIESA